MTEPPQIETFALVHRLLSIAKSDDAEARFASVEPQITWDVLSLVLGMAEEEGKNQQEAFGAALLAAQQLRDRTLRFLTACRLAMLMLEQMIAEKIAPGAR